MDYSNGYYDDNEYSFDIQLTEDQLTYARPNTLNQSVLTEQKLNRLLETGKISSLDNIFDDNIVDYTTNHQIQQSDQWSSIGTITNTETSTNASLKTDLSVSSWNIYDPSTISSLIKDRLKVKPSDLLNISENHVNWSEIHKAIMKNLELSKMVTNLLQTKKLSVDIDLDKLWKQSMYYCTEELVPEFSIFSELCNTLDVQFNNLDVIVLYYEHLNIVLIWTLNDSKPIRLLILNPEDKNLLLMTICNALVDKDILVIDAVRVSEGKPIFSILSNNSDILLLEELIPFIRVSLVHKQIEKTKFLSTISIVAILEGILRYTPKDKSEIHKIAGFMKTITEVDNLDQFCLIKTENHKIDLAFDTIRNEVVQRRKIGSKELKFYECPMFHRIIVCISNYLILLQFCDHGKHYSYTVYYALHELPNLMQLMSKILTTIDIDKLTTKETVLYEQLLPYYKEFYSYSINVCQVSMKAINHNITIVTTPKKCMNIHNAISITSYLSTPSKVAISEDEEVNVQLDIEYQLKQHERNKFDLKKRSLYVKIQNVNILKTALYRVLHKSDTIISIQ